MILLLLALALAALPAAAFGQEAGLIAGQVTMGSAGAGLPDDLEVELLFLPNGQGPPQVRTAPVDASGNFRFDNVDPSPQHRYLVRVTYAGQTYFSPAGDPSSAEGPFVLAFQPNQVEIVAPLTIYETTSETGGLQAGQIHYILDEQNGLWIVGALYSFENQGDQVIVPDASAGGIRIPLPPEAINVGFQDPAVQEAARIDADGILLTHAFLPGTNEIIFSYQMPYNPPDQRLRLPLGYPAPSVVVLVPELGQKTEVTGLEAAGDNQFEGRTFALFRGPAPDQPVEIALTNLPPPSLPDPDPATAGGAASPLPEPGLDAWPWWVPLVLVAAAVAGIALYLWQRPAPTAVEERVALRRRRDALIQYIADLDDRYERNEIGPETYQRQRRAAKRELYDIMRRLSQGGELQPSG